MKKYICLLLILLFPMIALADCESDIQENMTSMKDHWDTGVLYYKCDEKQEIGEPGTNNPCFDGVTRMRATLSVSMGTYNNCSTHVHAQKLYDTIQEYLAKYNGMKSNPQLDLNKGTSPCQNDISDSLDKIYNRFTTFSNDCWSSGAQANCLNSQTMLRNQFDRSKIILTTHAKTSCDLVAYKNKVMDYINEYNAHSSNKYDYEAGSNTCITEATDMIKKMEDSKSKVKDNKCDNDKEVSNECKSYINAYKEVIAKAVKKKADFSACSAEVHYETLVQGHINYFDMISYIRDNGKSFESIERQQKEINKDATFCPLGSDVTQDLVGVLRIMKIAAPLLVLVLTVYEVIKNIMEGEIEAKSKELFKKFGKRCLGALLLFAIPVLIDIFMQLLNVWDDTGRCVLVETETNYDATNSTSSTTK